VLELAYSGRPGSDGQIIYLPLFPLKPAGSPELAGWKSVDQIMVCYSLGILLSFLFGWMVRSRMLKANCEQCQCNTFNYRRNLRKRILEEIRSYRRDSSCSGGASEQEEDAQGGAQ
jgi:hypothetical protein